MSDLSAVTLDDLYGEIRRRKPTQHDMQQELGIYETPSRDSEAVLKRVALRALAMITLLLVVLIAYLSATGTEIPDLVSGLTGSGIGAIAGLLSSGSPRGSVSAQSE